jgi:hypothetical protein
MRPAHGIVLLGTAYALTGCGVSQRDQVQAKLQQFAHATASRNATELCDQVLAPALVQRLQAADLTCGQAMKVFVQSVQNPTLSVSKITVKGNTATAIVLAGATGQPAALETVTLSDTKRGWRLSSLATPR